MNFNFQKLNRKKRKKISKAQKKQKINAYLEEKKENEIKNKEIRKYVLQRRNEKIEEVINKNNQARLNKNKRASE